MGRFPFEYKKKYNLSDVHIKPDPKKIPRGTGSDLSEQSYVIYIGSAPLERMVAIKAFASAIKINFQKEKEMVSIANQTQIHVKEKHGSLSYDITLDMPAHSVNEAANNLAKIEELQRLITKGPNWEMVSNYTEKVVQDPSVPGKTTTQSFFVGNSYEGVSEKYKTTMPLFFVFFKNIVNGGKKWFSSTIRNFDDLGNKGFPCYIESIKYDPDTSAGFFDFDNFLYPKNIKLNLKLNYESETLFDLDSDITKNKTILPFKVDGSLTEHDTGLFPFHVDIRVKDMNDLSYNPSNKRKDSFLFIASPNNTSDKDKITNNLTTKESMPRYVMFDLFLDEFSRDLQYSFEKEEAGNSTVYSKVKQDLNIFKHLKYSIKLNVVSDSLMEAKRNAAKMQYLSRMFYKTFYDGTQVVKKSNVSGLSQTEILQNLLVYIPTMIEKPSDSKYKSVNFEDMVQRALPLYLEEFSFDMNMELGFFVEGDKIYPKAYSLNLGFIYLKDNLIYNYHATYLDDDDQQYIISVPDSNEGEEKIITKDNAWLFPYNRKTIHLGGA